MSEYRLPAVLVFEGNVAEKWKKWKQQFTIYMLASGKDDKPEHIKIAILLNLMGEDALAVYNNFKWKDNKDKSLETVINKFDKHFEPRKNVVFERYKFFSRSQEENETFDHFLTEMKMLAKSCEFGEQEESLIRDRIVLGIQNAEMRERLLRVADLSLQEAADGCRALEIARQQAKIMREEGPNVAEESIDPSWRLLKNLDIPFGN